MAYFAVCPDCGANLDPGEHCDCEKRIKQKSRGEKQTMKKRSCRMTAEERDLHEQAVRVRKMTDQQLVDHIKHIQQDAYAAGYADAEAAPIEPQSTGKTLGAFIEDLANGRCKGIKSATVFKLEEFARAEGYIV